MIFLLDWQECYDEQTGYPYYWHTETNQVTWEMPSELKTIQDKQKQIDSLTATRETRDAQIRQWSNASQNDCMYVFFFNLIFIKSNFIINIVDKQMQNSIPDGMIPKEVVVRNRNRQAGIINKPTKPVKTESFKQSSKKNYSDDYEYVSCV